CSYFNPFSNAVPSAPRNGNVANPGFISAVQNTADLTSWFFPYQESTTTSQNWEGNVVLNGHLGMWTLPGGDIGWAAGGQWRRNEFKSVFSEFANAVTSPCADTPVTGSTTCTPHTSPAVFLGVGNPQQLSQDIYAAFVEV